MDLSIILGGRDDNYGKNFIERLNMALTYNLSFLSKSDLAFEIIVVDFNPINKKYLYQNSILKETLSNTKILNLIIDPSVSDAEGLYKETYYEYFAKNAGARVSNGKFLFLTNSDIIITELLISEIKNELINEHKDDFFYRCRYRGETNLNQFPDNISVIDLHKPELSDSCICGLFSGDATMFSRNVFFNIATGYNETEIKHRTKYNQSAMDGEILWNVYKQGKTLKFLESPYYHIKHERPNQRDNFYSNEIYRNDSDWGFVSYNKTTLDNNVILISNNAN